LLIILHGNGGNAVSFARIWDAFADPSFIMAVPQGAYDVSGGSHRGRAMFSWYYLTDSRAIWKMADPLAEESIENVIDAVRAAQRINRVFILGFSQGASLAYAVGIKNHGKVDGIIALAGIFPQESLTADQVAAARHLPVFVARGHQDAQVPQAVFDHQVKRLREGGFDLTAFSFRGGHELPPDLLARVQEWMKDCPKEAKTGG